MDLLDIKSPVVFDESVSHWEMHSHLPYNSSNYKNNDEIHIKIQYEDQCLLPSKSFLRVVGKIVAEDGTKLKDGTNMVNLAFLHLFSEIRYELNAVEIDKSKNVGVSSLMKAYASLNNNEIKFLEIAGWNTNKLFQGDVNLNAIFDGEGNFEIMIPLSLILGFAEDYKKIIVNAKHELILTRSNTDKNAIIQSAKAVTDKNTFKFTFKKIEWLMPTILLSNARKASLLKYIEKDPTLDVSFRSWELYEYPQLPESSRHIWTVKSSSQLEKPRYVILAFQTARNNELKTNASEFDHCNIRNVKLYLNSQYYPYGELNIDFESNRFARLYEMFARFQESYYGKSIEPLIDKAVFRQTAPLIIFDCSKQNETLKSTPVDVRLEFETREDIPKKTSAFCLIIHDRIIQYKPISGEVKRLM